jgi:hypothetical protein
MGGRLGSATLTGVVTFAGCAIAYVASLGACRGENVGSSSLCPPVDDHADGAFWLGVALPSVIAAVAVAAGAFSGRWSKARFAFIAVWAGYLIAVLASSPNS